MARKSTKKIAASQNKQPRAKTEADIRHNARRRLKTQLKNAQRSAKAVTESGQRYIAQLQQLIKSSYAERKGGKPQYKYSVETAEKVTKQVIETARRTENIERAQRKNKMFANKLALAKRGEDKDITAVEVNVFYTVTRQFWEGKPKNLRNEAIIEGLGLGPTGTLEEAWKIVFENEQAKEAVRRGKAAQQPAGSDEDMYDGTGEPSDEAGSPPYIQYFIAVSTRKSK